MPSDNVEKLYKILDILEQSGKDRKNIEKIRNLIDLGNLQEALDEIRILNNEGNVDKSDTSNLKKKRKAVKTENVEKADENEIQKEIENHKSDNKEEIKEEELEGESGEEDSEDEENLGDEEEYDDELEEDEENENIKYKEEVKIKESSYPEKLRAETLERAYIGLLLNNPKLIVKYYILFEECYFDDQDLLNIYKSILFTEAGKYTPEIAKKGFNFSVDNVEIYKLKQELKNEISEKNCNPEKIYLELRKLFTLRKSYLEEPREEIQKEITGIKYYERYDKM